MELHFADAATKKKFDCFKCAQQKARKCEEPGFQNFKKGGLSITKGGPQYPFCPGKARKETWALELFDLCRLAVQTGIMPNAGGLDDQDALFAEVFPVFAANWKEYTYRDIWKDVAKFTADTLKAVLGKK